MLVWSPNSANQRHSESVTTVAESLYVNFRIKEKKNSLEGQELHNVSPSSKFWNVK